MMLQLLTAAAAFAPPSRVALGVSHASVTRAPPAVAIELPFIGKIDLPSFGGGGDFKLFPSDVQFTDVDGDVVTLRPISGTKVDFYSNGNLVISGAGLVRNGNTLEISGKIRKGFGGIVLPGFELEDNVTEGTTPRDPADLDKAMALVE